MFYVIYTHLPYTILTERTIMFYIHCASLFYNLGEQKGQRSKLSIINFSTIQSWGSVALLCYRAK